MSGKPAKPPKLRPCKECKGAIRRPCEICQGRGHVDDRPADADAVELDTEVAECVGPFLHAWASVQKHGVRDALWLIEGDDAAAWDDAFIEALTIFDDELARLETGAAEDGEQRTVDHHQGV